MIAWALRIVSSLFRRNPEADHDQPVEMLVRPKFKDFRYSGGTYEESQENYRAALKEYNLRTGREWEE